MRGSYKSCLNGLLWFTIIANAFVPIQSKANVFSWHPLTVETEAVLKFDSDNGLPCSRATGVSQSYTTAPPVHLVGTINMNNYALAAGWSPDGRYLVTSGDNLEVWNFPELKKLRTIRRASSLGNPKVVFENSREFLTTTINQYDGVNPNAFSLIDAGSGNVIREISGFSNPPRYPLANSTQGYEFSPDAKYLFSWFNGNTLRTFIYSTNSWQIKLVAPIDVSLMTGGPGPDDMTFLDPLFPDNKPNQITNMSTFLIMNGQNGFIEYKFHLFNTSVFDARAMATNWNDCVVGFGARSVRHKNPNTAVNPVPYIQVENPEDAVKLWYPSASKIVDIPAKTPIESVALSSKGHLLAYVDGNLQAKVVWLSGTLDDESEITTLASFGVEATDVQFSPDGKYLAVLGDNLIIIYQIG